jgi:hypothetical protein
VEVEYLDWRDISCVVEREGIAEDFTVTVVVVVVEKLKNIGVADVVVVSDVVFEKVFPFVVVTESVFDEFVKQLHFLTSNQGFRSFLLFVGFSFKQAPPLMLHLRARFCSPKEALLAHPLHGDHCSHCSQRGSKLSVIF